MPVIRKYIFASVLLCTLIINKFPTPGPCVMPKYVFPAVIPDNLEIPMRRRQPAVFHGDDFHGPVAQPEPAGCFFTAVPGIT
jgi:hypothetical protein